MLELIKYIVNQFAENPETAEYKVEENGNVVDVTVLLQESDMGKVIGRQGKIAKALRTIVNAASKKSGKRYNIEIKGKDEQ
ncbi:MAG: KH domain-containing protein [Clostridiales bacterium]|nr:KH domain-containing protein [Clostridiales bacterium]